MVTIVFLSSLGIIVVGFVLWVLAFGGMKRRGQSSQAEVNAQQMNEPPKRGS